MSLKKVKNAKTLSALASALEYAADNIKQDVSNINQKVTSYAVQRLIYETPVDTSQALSNWRVNVNYAISGTLPAYFYGEQGSTKGISASTALGAAKQQIARKKYGMTLVIANNLDYINDLNEGKSPQADVYYVYKIAADAENVADAELRRYVNGD